VTYLHLKLVIFVGGCHHDDSSRATRNLACCRRTSRLVGSRWHVLDGILPIRNSAITRAHIRDSGQSTGHDIVRNLNVVLLSISDSCAMTALSLSNLFLSLQYGSSSLEARRAALSYTYLLTPWNRVFLEKLTSSQLVKKFPAFYVTQRFITAFTSVRHLSLS
jgi:hypothetical protein